MAKDADSSYHCVVSVLGYVSHGKIYHSSSDGTGKSCLCCRFAHPALDDYMDDHPTLLALHEFESQVVCTDSFLYWGPKEIELACNNSKQGRRSAKVKIEVVEHTLFYHDETCRIFKPLEELRLHDVDKYAKRSLLPPESSRKTSYYTRDCIGFPDRYECLPYPSNINRIARGFIIACDVSIKMPQFEAHLVATEQIAHRLFKDSKHPFIVVATKRDMAEPISLQKLHDWASKKRITLLETSAKENINIKSAFSFIAAKIFKSAKLTTPFMSYSDAVGASLTETTKLKTSYKNFLKRKITSSGASLGAIEDCQEYIMAVETLGKFGADEIYARNLLEVRDREIRGFPGVMENPDMRMEILEQFVDEIMMDLIAHKRTLRSMINTLVSPCDDFYINEGRYSAGSSPTKQVSTDKAPLLTPDDIYDEVDDLPFVQRKATESIKAPTFLQNVDETYDNFDNLSATYRTVSADSSPIVSARPKPLPTLDRSALLKRTLPLSASSSPITPRSSAMFQQTTGLSQELQKMLTKQVDSRNTSSEESLVEDVSKFAKYTDYQLRAESVSPVPQTKLVDSESLDDSNDISDRYGFLQAPDQRKMSSIVSESLRDSSGNETEGTQLKKSPTPPPPPKRLHKKDKSHDLLTSSSSPSPPLVVTKEFPQLPSDLKQDIHSFGPLPPLPDKILPVIPKRLRKVETTPQAEGRVPQERISPVSISHLGPHNIASTIYQNRGGVQPDQLPKPNIRPKSPRASKSPPPLPQKDFTFTSSHTPPQPHNVAPSPQPPLVPINILDSTIAKRQSKGNSQNASLPQLPDKEDTNHSKSAPDPVPKPKPKPKNYKMVTLNKQGGGGGGPPKPPPKPSNYPSVTIKNTSPPPVVQQEDEDIYIVPSDEVPDPHKALPTNTVPSLPHVKPNLTNYEMARLRLEGKPFQEKPNQEEGQGDEDYDIYISSSANLDEAAAVIDTQQSRDPPASEGTSKRSNYEIAKLRLQGKDISSVSSQEKEISEQAEQDDVDIYISSSTDPNEDLKDTKTTPVTVTPTKTTPIKTTPPVVQNKPSSYELAKLKKAQQAKERSPSPGRLPQYEKTAPKLDTSRKTVSADSSEYKPRLEALRKKVEENKKSDGQPGPPPPAYPAPPLPTAVEGTSPSIGRRFDTTAKTLFEGQTPETNVNYIIGRMAQSKSMEISNNQRKNYTTHTLPKNYPIHTLPKNYPIHTLPKQQAHPTTAAPPPLPPRTEDMKDFSSVEDIRDPSPLVSPPPVPAVTERTRSKTVMDHTSTSTPPKARKNYLDMVKKVFTSSKDRETDISEEESLTSSSEGPKPPQFIRMRGRPLPAAPKENMTFDVEDPTADYEPVDDFSSLSRFQHTSPPHREIIPPAIVPPDPSILDNPEQMRAFITQIMAMNQTQQQPAGGGVFQYPETSLRPQLHPSPSKKPKRSQSVNYRYQTHQSDTTDADGYEVTDEWIPPRGPGSFPDDSEYHYPSVRGFKGGRRAVPPRSPSMSPLKSPKLPARSPPPDENDDEYMNFHGDRVTEDYDYENFDIINNLRSGGSLDNPNVSPLKKLPRPISMDDMHIYYNMRERDFPLDVSTSTLPPRKAKGYEKPVMMGSLSSSELNVDEETGQKLSEKEAVSTKKAFRPLPPRNKPRHGVNYGQTE